MPTNTRLVSIAPGFAIFSNRARVLQEIGGDGMRFLEFVRQQGYHRHTGTESASVYAYFRCENPARAQWYFKPGSFQCAGCKAQCETDSPEGFQTFLTPEKRNA